MKDKLKNRIRRKVFGVLFLLLCAVFLKPLSGVAAEETSFTEYDFIPWPWPKIGCVSQFLEYEWSLFDREKRFFQQH